MFEESQKIKCKPFVKWVGGKTQMLKYLNPLVKGIDFTKNKYIEPFVGGGALFFHIQPKNAILSDFNKELITAYRTINGPKKLDKLIDLLEKKYIPYSNNGVLDFDQSAGNDPNIPNEWHTLRSEGKSIFNKLIIHKGNMHLISKSIW